MKKEYWYYSIGNGIGLLVGMMGSSEFGYPYLFWFIGGLIMGISAMVFLGDKEKTNKVFLYSMPLIIGLVMMLVIYITDLIGLDYFN